MMIRQEIIIIVKLYFIEVDRYVTPRHNPIIQ